MELPFKVININKKLKKLFGTNMYGNAIFRVSYSDNELEKREGVFNIFYGHIFVKEVKGIRECKKYPWISDRFIIEKWRPASEIFDKSIPDTIHGGYEVFYVFEDKDGNPLDVIERFTIIACQVNLNPIGYWERKRLLEEREKQNEQDAYDEVYYGVELTPVTMALRMGEGVTVPRKDIK